MSYSKPNITHINNYILVLRDNNKYYINCTSRVCTSIFFGKITIVLIENFFMTIRTYVKEFHS